ncbi:MAG: glycosyltransferase [Solirubrobacteraceae bacterium]
MRASEEQGTPVASTGCSHAPQRRVALVHDYLLVMRGAERTFAAIADIYPHAAIGTLLYDARAMDTRFGGRAIVTSPLQRLGVRQGAFRRLLPLYPYAVRHIRLPSCELVLSSSSAFAHGVRVPGGARHLCYCHAPFRYAWYEQERALSETPRPLRPAMRAQLARMRRWDRAASRGVDAYVANSQLTRERIARHYERESVVIHPPVETERFSRAQPGQALLVVSEIVAHKRVQVALEAARRAQAPIRVVGSGPDHAALSAAYPEAQFLGRVDDARLAELYAQARALIVASREEFGIAAVEAQAAGRPVIAAAAGGALETVIDGETGLLAPLDDADAFANAIAELERIDFDPAAAERNAERFSVAAFRRRLLTEVERLAAESAASPPRGRSSTSHMEDP